MSDTSIEPSPKRRRQTAQQKLASMSASLSDAIAGKPLYTSESDDSPPPRPSPAPSEPDPMPPPPPEPSVTLSPTSVLSMMDAQAMPLPPMPPSPMPPSPMPTPAPFSTDEMPRVADLPRQHVPSPAVLRSLEAQRAFETTMAHEDAVAELLADLDFEKVPYQIDLIRKEPEYHPDGTYIGLGWAATYTEPVTLKQIADKFGGGKYQLVVRVPTAQGSQKYRFFDSKVIYVTGEPAIPPSRSKKVAVETETGKAAEVMREMVTRQIEMMDAQVREVKKEAKEMVAAVQQANHPSLLMDIVRESKRDTKDMLAAVQQANNPSLLMDIVRESKKDAKDMLAAVQQANNPAMLMEILRDSKKDTKEMLASVQQANNPSMMLEMMREERKMQEMRLAAEKEERAREREEERRRFEMQIEQTRLQHEKQLELLRMEAKERSELAARQAEQVRIEAKERAELAARQAEQAREEARRLASEQPKTMETMMMFMQKMDAEKQASAQKASEFMMQMMQQSAQNNVQQMQAAQNLQVTILSEALREAKTNKNDILEMATQFKTLKSVFGGETETAAAAPLPGMSWQDIVREGVDKLPTIIQAIRPNPPSPGAEPAAAPGPKAVGPGAAAVLENPPSRRPRRLTDGASQFAGALPPANTPPADAPSAPPSDGAGVSTTPAADAAKQEEPAVTGDNDLSDYMIIDNMDNPEATMIALVKSLDLGLQRGLSSRSLYDQIFAKFPGSLHLLLRMTSVGQIQEIIAKKAPKHWVINTPRGRRALEEVYSLLTTGNLP